MPGCPTSDADVVEAVPLARRRLKQQKPTVEIAKAARPPTAPPTIAPMLVELPPPEPGLVVGYSVGLLVIVKCVFDHTGS